MATRNPQKKEKEEGKITKNKKEGENKNLFDRIQELKQVLETKFKDSNVKRVTFISAAVIGVIIIFLLGMFSMSIAKNRTISSLKESVKVTSETVDQTAVQINQITKELDTVVEGTLIEDALLRREGSLSPPHFLQNCPGLNTIKKLLMMRQ